MMIGNILDNTTELWMTKYIIGEILSSGGATFPSNQTVENVNKQLIDYMTNYLACLLLVQQWFPPIGKEYLITCLSLLGLLML